MVKFFKSILRIIRISMDANADVIDVDDSLTHRRFVSVQRRYDNVRVRDSEITQRLCYDCGEVVIGGEREYQDHILIHEAVYLAYQLYHFEKNQQASSLEHNKKQLSSLSEKPNKEKDLKHKDVAEQPSMKVPKRDDSKDVIEARENAVARGPERKSKSEQQQSVSGSKRDQKSKEESARASQLEKSVKQVLTDEQKPKVPVDSVPVDKSAWTSLYFIRGGGDGAVIASDKQADDRSKKSLVQRETLGEPVEKLVPVPRPSNRLVDLQTPVNSVPVLPEEEAISIGRKAGLSKNEQSQRPISSTSVSHTETTSSYNTNENRVEKQPALSITSFESNKIIVAETIEHILDAIELQIIPDNTTTQLSSPPTLTFQSSPPTLSLATSVPSTESVFCTVTTASTSNGQPGELSAQQTPTNERVVEDDLSMESADISVGSF